MRHMNVCHISNGVGYYMRKYVASLITLTAAAGASNVHAQDEFSFPVEIRQIEGRPLLHMKLVSSSASFSPQASTFRLWGAELIAPIPNEILFGEFECEIAGSFTSSRAEIVRILKCHNSEIDLSQAVIRNGFAVEICSETDGAFGTC